MHDNFMFVCTLIAELWALLTAGKIFQLAAPLANLLRNELYGRKWKEVQ